MSLSLFVDPRAGSKNLIGPLKALGLKVEHTKQLTADVEGLGWGPDGPFVWGLEHKSAVTGDIFTSMQDGRLTGTQLPLMRANYQRIYLMIEGALRIADDGVLEVSPRPGMWTQAGSRNGSGWLAETFYQRIESIQEFSFDEQGNRIPTHVIFTHNSKESARRIATIYKYWSKPYESHSSYKQWDQSNGKKDAGAPAKHSVNTLALMTCVTSDIPLVQRWAREIEGIGQESSGYVAKHFGSALNMALADEKEWTRIELLQKLKTKSGYRRVHIGRDRAKQIVAEIRGEGGREKP